MIVLHEMIWENPAVKAFKENTKLPITKGTFYNLHRLCINICEQEDWKYRDYYAEECGRFIPMIQCNMVTFLLMLPSNLRMLMLAYSLNMSIPDICNSWDLMHEEFPNGAKRGTIHYRIKKVAQLYYKVSGNMWYGDTLGNCITEDGYVAQYGFLGMSRLMQNYGTMNPEELQKDLDARALMYSPNIGEKTYNVIATEMDKLGYPLKGYEKMT